MKFRMSGTLMALVLVAAGFIVAAHAADPASRSYKKGQYNPAHASVEMFDGIKEGKIAVKLIHKDETEAKLLITNKTNEALNVKIPDAFAGVHVLAQFGGGGMGGGGMGGQAQNTGMGGGGMGGGGMGGAGGAGGGMFNVPADKVGELRVQSVCLEHGKPEPRPNMPYEVRPITSISSKPGVAEICYEMSTGRLDRRVAQAAVWHLNNGMSWQELASKEIKPLIGDPYAYFSPQEMQAAVMVAEQAVKLAEEKARKQPQTSPGESAAARSSEIGSPVK